MCMAREFRRYMDGFLIFASKGKEGKTVYDSFFKAALRNGLLPKLLRFWTHKERFPNRRGNGVQHKRRHLAGFRNN